jgi:NAD(P)-dependent dehydrogenase (short-subunit alcohol dehydrogenase family)
MSAPIAIVTGGNRGLGRDMVRKLAAQGTDVIFTYRNNKAEADAVLAELASPPQRLAALPLNVSDASTFAPFAARVAQLLGTWGRERFDFLVNNAGHGVHASFLDTTEEQFDELVAVHLKGVFFLTQELVPLMADGGRIVNVSTGLTRFAQPGMSAYASMKGAVEVLTRYLAKELGGRGIAVNTVAPGAIETDFGGGAVRDNARMNAQLASVTALGRVGRPDDIGGVVASLLLPANRWINAQRIEASGGMFL